MVAGRRIDAGTVIWGAGIKASPAAGMLGAALDGAGRVPLNPDLSVKGVADVYALGDMANTPDDKGAPLPALAQVAAQQGTYLGRALARNLVDGEPLPPFKFHNRGNTAIVGRHAAVFDFGWMQLKGRFAWLMWAIIHVYLLVGFDNRVRVSAAMAVGLRHLRTRRAVDHARFRFVVPIATPAAALPARGSPPVSPAHRRRSSASFRHSPDRSRC